MIEEISIWWEGPFTVKEVVSNKIDSTEYDNTANRVGVYQIYGTHPLYGNDVLLYIGRTKNNKGFRDRLNNRWETDQDSNTENVKIYLGTIFTATEKKLSKEKEYKQIDNAEVLLINAMKPAFNSSNIKSVGKKYSDSEYMVTNLNNYKNIYPQLTSSYYWKDFLNTMIVDELVKELDVKVEEGDDFYGFNMPQNDNIFFGIEYKIWNEENIPLVIGIFKEAIKKSDFKNNDLLEFVSKDKYYYYFTVLSEFRNKEVTEIITDIKKQLEAIVSFLEGYTK